MALTHVTWTCIFASYLVALVLELTQLWRPSRLRRWAMMLMTAAGLVAHTAYLVTRAQDGQLPPLVNSTHDWLLVLSWLAVVLMLSVLVWNRQLAIGLFGLPAVVLMVGAARFVRQSTSPVLLEPQRWRTMVHASLWVVGIAGVVISFVLSLMYLVQHRRLKLKLTEPSELKLFSLERLSRWNWWSVIVSVPLLTLALVSGVLLAWQSHVTGTPVDLVQFGFLLTGGLWLAMAVLFGWLLTARHAGGKVVALRTVWACGVLLAMLLAQQVFTRGGVHGRAASGETAPATPYNTPTPSSGAQPSGAQPSSEEGAP